MPICIIFAPLIAGFGLLIGIGATAASGILAVAAGAFASLVGTAFAPVVALLIGIGVTAVGVVAAGFSLLIGIGVAAAGSLAVAPVVAGFGLLISIGATAVGVVTAGFSLLIGTGATAVTTVGTIALALYKFTSVVRFGRLAWRFGSSIIWVIGVRLGLLYVDEIDDMQIDRVKSKYADL